MVQHPKRRMNRVKLSEMHSFTIFITVLCVISMVQEQESLWTVDVLV